jgi:glycerol kinase
MEYQYGGSPSRLQSLGSANVGLRFVIGIASMLTNCKGNGCPFYAIDFRDQVGWLLENDDSIRNVARTDGGVTRNTSVMQLQSDILGRRVRRSVNEQVSSVCAAWLCGLALGWWTSITNLESVAANVVCFSLETDLKQRDQVYEGWKKAMSKVCSRETVYA